MAAKSGLSYFTFLGICLFPLLLVTGTKNVDAEDKAEAQTTTISLCEWHITHRFAKEAVRIAYQRIGISPEFVELPCRRSLVEANAGAFDGEVGRISGIQKIYPRLIPMDSPTVTIEGVVFTKSIDRAITKWRDLSGLKIGIIRGELYAEAGTAGLGPEVVNSYHQLLIMVAKGRLDVGVVIKRDFEVEIGGGQFVGRGLHIIGDPVFSAPLFHLVHENHRERIPKLNAVFKEMWESGETRSIHQETMRRIASQAVTPK